MFSFLSFPFSFPFAHFALAALFLSSTEGVTVGIAGCDNVKGFGKSHSAPMVSIIKELTDQGHEVFCFYHVSVKGICGKDLMRFC